MLTKSTIALFGLVVTIALAMSWYSMFDLAYNYYHVLIILSVFVSFAFDLGALFLGKVSVEYAKTNDSGFLAEAGTFLFVIASIYLNVSHAMLAGYGIPGMVLFGAAPVIAGITLKIYLSFITRQARKDAGRIVERLPVTGRLTWMLYPKQSFKLLQVAMQHRLINAAGQMDMPEDKHALFSKPAQAAIADKASEKIQATVPEDTAKAPEIKSENTLPASQALLLPIENSSQQLPARTEADIDEIVYQGEIMDIPAWLPRDATISLNKLSAICVENGVTDISQIYEWAKTIKKTSQINRQTIQKSVFRAKAKESNLL